MAIRIKKDTSWYGPVADGTLRIDVGAGWYSPSRVYCKVGTAGGGYWQDSGYRGGTPNPPQSAWVDSWGFNYVSIGFSAPAAGGPPAVSYQVLQTDANGNEISTVTVGSTPSGNFGAVEDGRYQFFVRSKSATGSVSGWTAAVKVQIGHTEQGYSTTEPRTRAWWSPSSGGRWYNRDQPMAQIAPSNVVIAGAYWRNLYTPQSDIVSPGPNRTVNWLLPWTSNPINDNIGTVYNGNSWDYSLGGWGDGSYWGIVPRGTGWGVWNDSGDEYSMLWSDDFFLAGTEYYDHPIYVVTRSYAANSYW